MFLFVFQTLLGEASYVMSKTQLKIPVYYVQVYFFHYSKVGLCHGILEEYIHHFLQRPLQKHLKCPSTHWCYLQEKQKSLQKFAENAYSEKTAQRCQNFGIKINFNFIFDELFGVLLCTCIFKWLCNGVPYYMWLLLSKCYFTVFPCIFYSFLKR